MALLDAVARGDLEAVKKLMGKKPKKGELVCETCGTSVLSKATEKGDISIVQFLLGRDDIFRYISEKNKLGYTAWDLAQKYGHDEVAKLISWRMTGEANTKEDLEAKCRSQVTDFIQDEAHLGWFFKGDSLEEMLKPVVKKATNAAWNVGDLGITNEEALGLSLLTIYDVAILIDDSGSMQFEEQGRRKAAVKLGLQAITKIHAMLSREADDVPSAVKKSGIKRVQFMNRPVKRDLFKVTNIKDAKQIEELIDNHKFGGGSPIGDGLRDNILNPLVFKRKSPFTKPLLVMIITDGGIHPSQIEILVDNISKSVETLQQEFKVPQESQAIAFQFVRVGNDKVAARMLKQLHKHPKVGRYINSSTADWDVDDMLYMSDNYKRQRMMEVMLSAISETWSVNTDDDDHSSEEEEDDVE